MSGWPAASPRRPPLALLRARFPKAVVDVLETLDRAGHRSWIVGGAVRDLLLRRGAAVDHDVATPARPEEVAAIFPRTLPTGVAHGTVTVLAGPVPVEVTTFRGEGPYLDGRRPSSVTFLADLEEDLARRDFTVNALAYDPIRQELRDPFGGREDLRRGILRAVGDPAQRFREDGLRPLRAARFVAQLGFSVEPLTAAAIPGALEVTERVSAERVGAEIVKLVTGPHALRALELLDGCGLLSRTLPVLAALPVEERHHAFRACAGIEAEPALRLAALLHALSARRAPEAAGEETRILLSALRLPKSLRETAARLVQQHACLMGPSRPPPPAQEADVRRWLSQVGRAQTGAALALWRADVRALRPLARSAAEGKALRAFRSRLERVERERPPLAVGDLALAGAEVMQELGIQGGPAVGAALRHLLERVLEDPGLNDPARLREKLRAWWASRSP